MQAKYLIIGVNAAGFYAIEALRQHDSNSSIIAINGEPHGPYKRTKINKKFWPPNLNIDKYQLAEPSWYKENNITLLNNTNVASINASSKTAVLSTGQIIEWDHLLLSTGADSYCPDSVVFMQAVSIRTYSDALRVKELIKSEETCLVYGLGIEGIETAAQISEAGLKVTIAGRGNVILKRYFSSPIAAMIEKLFAIKNIPILYNTAIESLLFYGSDNQVCINEVKGSFDFLLYSMGIKPKVDLAKTCNIIYDKGIIVNSKMETSIPFVYSAGDCTQIETGTITDHWHAAQDQGRTAAANMAGLDAEWPSKKYRVKVEIFGEYFFSMRPFLEIATGDCDIEESPLSYGAYRLFYYKNDILKGIEMTGDKPRAKLYEAAVNEEWDRAKVEELLGFNPPG
ncbi:MAG: NAD(P)/FAD-dependent oxidoreductase [Spirochaetales bacterium]|nr:NAD(P)/FAD-dependent oxidoreductase [Spirochaetales bacterium]